MKTTTAFVAAYAAASEKYMGLKPIVRVESDHVVVKTPVVVHYWKFIAALTASQLISSLITASFTRQHEFTAYTAGVETGLGLCKGDFDAGYEAAQDAFGSERERGYEDGFYAGAAK